MRNLFSTLKTKRYLILFLVVMTVLNIAAITLLINNSFGQTTSEKNLDQPPMVVEVLVQNDTPFNLSVVDIDNSNPNYQVVNYLVENSSKHPVRAYVILGSSKISDVGTAITRRFAAKLFQPGAREKGWITVERKDIKPESKLYLSIDYVEFADSSRWGSDFAGQSEYIAGSRAGWIEALKNADVLVKERQSSNLLEFLKQTKEIVPPQDDSQKSDKWQKGYSSGYRTLISTLREQYETGGVDALTGKLNELRNTK